MSNNNKTSSRRPRSNSQQQSSNDASELLNFRLSPRPNQTQHHHHHHHRNNTNKRSSQKSYIPKNRLPQGAFPLHTSAQHVFYLSRIDTSNQRKVIQQTTPSKNTPQQQQQHTTLPSSSLFANAKLLQYQGPDTAIPWKSVKMVKRLLVSDGTQTTTTTISTSQCPICLDAFVCPRITKCGHVFCLCCLLQHLEHSKTLSYAAPKCPCCGISPICIEDLKPIEFTNVITPSTSTHSTPPPTNTQQDSTCEGGGQSQQQQPQQQKHQSSTSTRIQFLKLHRPKESFVPYIPQMGEMKRQQQQQHQQKQQHSNKSSSLLPVQGDNDSKFCRFNFIDTIQYKQELEQNLLELTRLEQDCHTPIERASVFEAMALVHQEQEGSLKNEIQFEQEIGCRMQQQEQQQDANNKNTKITTNASSSSSSSYNTIAAISFKNTPSTLFYQTYQERQEQQSVENKLQNCPPTSPPDRKLSIESYDGSEASYKEEHTKDDQQNQEEDGSGSPTATTAATLKNAKQRKSKRGGGKHKKHGGRGGSNRPAQYIPPTTMYLEDGSTHFYQSSDGQLCFLSGFNMKCLSTEFSIHSPDFVDDKDTTNKNKDTFDTNNEESPTQQQEQPQQQHYKRPLPDIVEGNVVEVEQMMLTPDLRKRLSFLSHLPLWTDICFVELDLHRLLSDATRKSLKNEFEKRKSRRAKKKQAEKRADRVAQKAEEHRIEELKARYQTIDPNDEFFLPPPQQHELGSDEIFPLDDSFGPSAAGGGGNGSSTSRSAATANNAPTAFSFRAVATVNGANPNLADTSSAEAFPTLGGGSNAMSQSPPKGLSSTINGTGAGATNWGSPPPNHSRGGGYSETSGRREGGRGAPPPPPPSFASATARRESNQITNNAPHHPTKGGRKGKGKKVVLFSTGGHRGTIY